MRHTFGAMVTSKMCGFGLEDLVSGLGFCGCGLGPGFESGYAAWVMG